MKQFKLRIPDDLHADLVRAAEASDRSLNAELIERLRRGVLSESIQSAVRQALREERSAERAERRAEHERDPLIRHLRS